MAFKQPRQSILIGDVLVELGEPLRVPHGIDPVVWATAYGQGAAQGFQAGYYRAKVALGEPKVVDLKVKLDRPR